MLNCNRRMCRYGLPASRHRTLPNGVTSKVLIPIRAVLAHHCGRTLAENEGIPPHEGDRWRVFERPAGDPDHPHAKVYKEWSSVGKQDQFGRTEDELPNNGNPSGSYRAWFYYPPDYKADWSEWTNIFQFKEEGYVDGKWVQEPSWWINTAVARAFNVSCDVGVLFCQSLRRLL